MSSGDRNDNDWESVFEWQVRYTDSGREHIDEIKEHVAKELADNLFKRDTEFIVKSTPTTLAIVFLYEAPKSPPYTQKADVIMEQCLCVFIDKGWIKRGGGDDDFDNLFSTVRYNHPVTVYGPERVIAHKDSAGSGMITPQ